MHLNNNHDGTRRQLLRTAAVGGGAIAAASVLPTVAQAATGSSPTVIGKPGPHQYVPGIDVLPDTTNALLTDFAQDAIEH